jgi:hypothetical protein
MNSNRLNSWSGFLIGCLLITVTSMPRAFAQRMPAMAENQLVIDSQATTIKLKWLGAQLQTKYEPYSALLLPVKLNGCPKQFYLQFDLGAPSTLLYANKVAQINAKYPRTFTHPDGATELKDLDLKLGKLNVKAKKLALKTYAPSTINWKNQQDVTVIGTLGADFIENKVVVIDYPKMELFIGNEIPVAVKTGLQLSDLLFMRRSVILPGMLNGKRTMVFFDTGASAYPLLTDKKTALAMASDSSATRNTIKSWNSEMIANTFNTMAEMTFAGKALPIKQVTYMEGVSSVQLEQMMKLGIGGMTGNKIFLNSILVLDLKRKKFGVATSNGN